MFYINIMLETCFTLILGIFKKIPIYFVSNFSSRKHFFTIFYFPRATGIETELGQLEELDNFHMNKTS
jgi:hypothetical protein